MDRSSFTIPKTLGAIALLALIGVLFAFSYRTTGQFDATLKAAGLNPQSLHPYQPAAARWTGAGVDVAPASKQGSG